MLGEAVVARQLAGRGVSVTQDSLDRVARHAYRLRDRAGPVTLLAQLQDDAAALAGSSKSTSNEGSISGTTKAVYTYGSTSDVWGATLTPAIVKNANFGVRLWFATSHDVRIDYVTIAVEYATAIQPTRTWHQFRRRMAA